MHGGGGVGLIDGSGLSCPTAVARVGATVAWTATFTDGTGAGDHCGDWINSGGIRPARIDKLDNRHVDGFLYERL
jgi:hypothetical protein